MKLQMCNHFYSLVDNFLKARIRPDAVTSNDVLNLAFNPRKAICEGDFASKIIVSENFTQANIEVCNGRPGGTYGDGWDLSKPNFSEMNFK